jgi:hypothetical protein
MRERLTSVKTTVILALVCLLGAAGTPAPSLASGGSNVVLGSAAFAGRYGEGWGTSKPAKIFNGGDPSGLVTHIHWTSWDSSSAIGYGLNAIFKPHGGYYSQLAHIELRAHVLGKCSASGPRAYTQLSVRAPSYPGGPLGGWMLWSGAKSICEFGF